VADLRAQLVRLRAELVRLRAQLVRLRAQLVRRKPVTAMAAETGADSGAGELSRTIGLFQLSMIGIGGVIGTGIFFVLSQAVPMAGPAVIWSFAIAGVVAGLTAVCYAELASAVPVSGSSYSYAYATMGELAAMVVASCLLLEYGVSTAAVAVGWSQYLNQFLGNLFGIRIPEVLSAAPDAGGWLNLPAVVLVALCALLLIRGTSESAKVNAAMVMTKLCVLALFVVIGVRGWNSDNLAHFAPYGISGIYGAAGVIFFTFVGLDAVSTAGEEVKNPRRTMPLAIMISLVTVTLVYVCVALVAVAAQPADKFQDQEAGLAAILQDVVGSSWPGTVLAAGAIISIFSVTLVVLYGQTRILFAMSRDGLVPSVFRRVNPRTVTPVRNTVIVAAAVAVLAGLIPIDFLSEMTSIGTLVAFIVVSIGVIVLRRTAPDLPRGFKVPGYPVTPALSVAGCLVIIYNLRPVTIVAFVIWTLVVLVWYFAWGIRHSELGRADRERTRIEGQS
jgi:APA family basic amino acid/polyamine antiporter